MFRWSVLLLMIAAMTGCTGLDHPGQPPLPPGQNHPEPETIDLETSVREAS